RSGELGDQRLGLAHVRRLETLREPAEDPRQELVSISALALSSPEPSQADRRAELAALGVLLLRDAERLSETRLRLCGRGPLSAALRAGRAGRRPSRGWRSASRLLEQDRPSQPRDLGGPVELSAGLAERVGLGKARQRLLVLPEVAVRLGERHELLGES